MPGIVTQRRIGSEESKIRDTEENNEKTERRSSCYFVLF